MCSTSNLSDECIAEKFKREHTDQFFVLVKMHLSFLLHMSTEESESFYDKGKFKKWNNIVPFAKKSKSKVAIEGAPLTQEGICQVYQLIEYLKKEQNLKSEGIFRRTGSLERQQELRNLLSQGVTLQLEGNCYSVHDCASVLKGFLAELPDPLLTESHFSVYCQIAESCNLNNQVAQENKMLESIQLLLLLLPNENKVLLKDILELLHLVTLDENDNRMSAENLAKLFTPHLLCPRKLSPENLLKDSQMLFGIVSFMIKMYEELFKIPSKLILDFRAHYEKKNILSPNKRLNESVNDAASTVFTFTDNKRTAKENEANPTETALAQLYAHIQSLPESSKKRKLVKQFNKENGHGTPLQVVRSGVLKNKSLGDSIKKHMFHKKLIKSVKKSSFLQAKSSSEEMLHNSPQSSQKTLISRGRLFCHNCDSSSDVSNDESPWKKLKIGPGNENLSKENDDSSKLLKRSISEPDLGADVACPNSNQYLTSTPACIQLCSCPDIVFTPEEKDRKSMSPITRSAQRMPRSMQETMMTPRSRKPVLLVSGTNINNLPKLEQHNRVMDNLSEESMDADYSEAKPVFKKSKSEGDINSEPNSAFNKNTTDIPSALTSTFREYLNSRDMLTLSSPIDSSFSSRTDDFNSTDFKNLSDNMLTDSLLYCLNGNEPKNYDDADGEENTEDGKQLVLKPKQFDENGKPIVFETSF